MKGSTMQRIDMRQSGVRMGNRVSKTNKAMQEPRPRHLLGIAEMSPTQLHALLALAQEIVKNATAYSGSLAGKTIVNLFYEPSTRTRSSFSMAAQHLGAELLDLTPQISSERKGESVLDTFLTLQAMQTDLFVLRHPAAGMPHQLAPKIHCSIVNAGDGNHEHPSQTLLDLLTILLHRGPLADLKIAIIGDVLHSRVARSFIFAVQKLGFGELRLIGPKTLVPQYLADKKIQISCDMDAGIKGVHVVMMLRLQKERMHSVCLPPGREFYELYGLSQARLQLADPQALVMHPGPFNRGMEISSSVADSSRSLIFKQVEYGVYARMAIFLSLLNADCAKEVWQ